MKSRLVVVIVLILNINVTNGGTTCEIPTDDKYVNCIVWKNYNVKTFQGQFLSFNSSCGYTILDFKKDGEPVRVDLANHKVHILAEGKKYELKLSETNEIQLKTNDSTYSIPTKRDSVEVIKPGRFAIAQFSSIGLEVKWDGEGFVVIQIDTQRKYTLSGLCSKSCPMDLSTFTTEWKLSDDCPVKTPKPCSSVAKKSAALQYCRNLINNRRYSTCIRKSNINWFLDECQQTYCNCDTKSHNDCMCDLVDAFVKHCEARTSQEIIWRKKGFCEKKCRNPHQRYKECGRRQKACGDPFTKPDKGVCIEGCTCPLNLWFTENKCVPEEQCPCRYENAIYEPGTSVVEECKTCVCINNNKWDCPPTICYGEADVYGDPHYTTFDGKRFDFMGKCSYYLVKGLDFAVIADHYVLENGQFVKNFKSNAPSWTKVVQVTHGDDVITLSPNLVASFNGKEIKKFPHKESNITISKPTSSNIIVELPNSKEVHWDGDNRAKIRLSTALRGYIQGLMGNFNKNPKDDFTLPDGTTTDDPNTFGHAWKVDGSCEEENIDPIPHPCEDMPSHRPIAEKACSALEGNLFKDCKDYNAEQSYESCVYDCCHSVELGEKCACEVIAAHAARCSNATRQWRKQVPACKIDCPTGQEYNYCLNPCESSCHYIGINPNCQKQCLEGCGCPEGETFDENQKCVPIEKCKCMLNGKHFPVGYKFLSNDNIKTCVKGKWEDSPADDADKKKYGSLEDLKSKCLQKPNSEYSACKATTPITCKNMDSYNEKPKDTCEEGCECIEGFVLNTANDSCVKQEECPCFINGKSYDESEERKTLTEKCVCKSDGWKCTKPENVSDKCNIFGDTSIRNLDGKVLSFESNCEYTLARGQVNKTPYVITIQSGDVNIIYTDKNEKVQATINKDGISFPNNEKIVDLDVRKVLEIETIGLKIIWNKGGFYSLQFKPDDTDKMQGLCGKLENSNDVVDSSNLKTFVDSWNNDPSCFELNIPKDKDVYGLDGKPLPTKCDNLKSDTFTPCTNQLPVDEYYNACVLAEQNPVYKDDTKSLENLYCQVFSAFSQECADAGNPVQWRSPKTCPMKCSGKKVYSECISTCTCDDIETLGTCPEKSCSEGCVSVECPKEIIYINNSFSECTTPDKCKTLKCLKDLENYEDNCKCEDAQVVCASPTTSVPESTTDEIPDNTSESNTEFPVIQPEDRTNIQEELIDAFYDVKGLLELINNPEIYDKLSPKDKQMIETFTNHVEEFEDEINCYANIVDKSKCKCFNGEQICGLTKNMQSEAQNDHDIQNNLELIKFMQSHLKCLEDLKENPLNCTCISGKKICPEKPIVVSTTVGPTVPPIYYYIIRCERRIIIGFYNLHFAKEGMNCLSQLPKNRQKNCRCEKGQMICSLQPKHNIRKPKEIPKEVYMDYINDVKKQLQCEVKIANRHETCRCENGKEICSKQPEPVPLDNNYEIVKQYINSPANKTQIYNTFEKGLECTEELGEESKVCTCVNGEKECFDMDYGIPSEEPPSNDSDPTKDVLGKIEGIKSRLVCLMKKSSAPHCPKFPFEDVNPTSEDILQLNVYLHYLRHINDQLTCLQSKPTYCTCLMGKRECSADIPIVPNQKEKENEQINMYDTFLDHIDNQMKCVLRLKGRGKNCFCDNGQDICSTSKNYVLYPLLDSDVLGEYDKEKAFPYIENQLKCYQTMKSISNRCSCKDGLVSCQEPEVSNPPEPEDNFSKMKRNIPDELKTVNKLNNKIRCFLSDGKRRNCHKIIPQQNVPQKISTPDKQLLKVYGTFFRHIKVQLTCYNGIINSNCMCLNGKLICGANHPSIDSYRHKAANTIYGYTYFTRFVDSQLNCLESLGNNNGREFCICENNQICGTEPRQHKLVPLLDVNTPTYKDPDVLYPYIDSQLKCLYELDNKMGMCYCSNGLKICDKQDYRTCPPINCPPNARMVRDCNECCPRCETEHCVVDVTSKGILNREVKKEVGDTWTDNCRDCQCIRTDLGPQSYCKQQQCPDLPDNDQWVYERLQKPGDCCPEYVPLGCKHDEKVYPINTVNYLSSCESISCILKPNRQIAKHIRKVTCNSTCPTGLIYKPLEGQCCGQCIALGCPYNNEIKQYNEVWFSEDKCYKFKCSKRNDMWFILRNRKHYRPIAECDGIIEMRECCPYCDKANILY